MNDRQRPSPQALLITTVLLCGMTSAFGQQDADVVRRLERQLREFDSMYRLTIPSDQPIAERLLLDFGGTYRFGFYTIDSPSGRTRILRQSDARLYLRAELDGTHRFFGRLRFLYNDWNTGDDFDGRGDAGISAVSPARRWSGRCTPPLRQPNMPPPRITVRILNAPSVPRVAGMVAWNRRTRK